jgi:hypothetical protein
MIGWGECGRKLLFAWRNEEILIFKIYVIWHFEVDTWKL